MLLDLLFEELPPGPTLVIELAFAGVVAFSGYMLATGYIGRQNCESQSVKWFEYVDKAPIAALDAKQRDQYALEYAKAHLACEKQGGPLLKTRRPPAGIEDLAKEPRIMARAKEMWDSEHGLLGLPNP